MAPPQAYVTAVVSVLLVTYPFTALVRYVREIHPYRLDMCTGSSPCEFMYIFGGQQTPRTGPGFAQLRADVERPLALAWDRSHGIYYLPDVVTGRRDMILFGYLFGGFHYGVPTMYDPSELENVFQLCVAGLCMSFPRWDVSFVWWESEHLRDLKLRVYASQPSHSEYGRSWLRNHSATAEGLEEVERAFEKYRQLWIIRFFRWMSQAGMNMLQLGILGMTGQDWSSHPEQLPSARCPNMDKSDMEALCHSRRVRAKFINTLATERSLKFYLYVTSIWVTGLVLHEILVLASQPEVITLSVSFVTLILQAFSVGSGLIAAAGACGVFMAPTGIEDCVCYYRLPDLELAIMVGTPFAQLLLFVRHRQYFAKAIAFGDFLYSKSFAVPQAVLRQNPGWNNHTIIARQSTTVEVYSQAKPATTPSKKLSEFILFMMMERSLTSIALVACYLPLMLVSSQIFARCMTFLAREEGFMYDAISTLPCLMSLAHVCYGLWLIRFRLTSAFIRDMFTHRVVWLWNGCKKLFGIDVEQPDLRSGVGNTFIKRTEALLVFYVDQLLGASLFLPPWFTFGVSKAPPAGLLIMQSYWAMGGLVFSLCWVHSMWLAVGVEIFRVLNIYEMYLVGDRQIPCYWYLTYKFGQNDWFDRIFGFCRSRGLLHRTFSSGLTHIMKQEYPDTYEQLRLDNPEEIRQQFEHDMPALQAYQKTAVAAPTLVQITPTLTQVRQKLDFIEKRFHAAERKLHTLQEPLLDCEQRAGSTKLSDEGCSSPSSPTAATRSKGGVSSATSLSPNSLTRNTTWQQDGTKWSKR